MIFCSKGYEMGQHEDKMTSHFDNTNNRQRTFTDRGEKLLKKNCVDNFYCFEGEETDSHRDKITV